MHCRVCRVVWYRCSIQQKAIVRNESEKVGGCTSWRALQSPHFVGVSFIRFEVKKGFRLFRVQIGSSVTNLWHWQRINLIEKHTG